MNDARGNGILFFSSSIESFPLWGPGRRGAFNFSSSSFWKSSFDVFPRRKTHHKKRERERERALSFCQRGRREDSKGKKRGGIFLFFSLFSKNRIEGETRAFLFHEYTTTDTKGLPFSSSSFVLRVDVKTQAYKYGRHAVKSAQVRASKARVLARCCVLRVRVFFLFVFYFGRKKEYEHFFSDLFSRNLKK